MSLTTREVFHAREASHAPEREQERRHCVSFSFVDDVFQSKREGVTRAFVVLGRTTLLTSDVGFQSRRQNTELTKYASSRTDLDDDVVVDDVTSFSAVDVVEIKSSLSTGVKTGDMTVTHRKEEIPL